MGCTVGHPPVGLRQGNYRRKRKLQKGAAGLFSHVFCGWDPKAAWPLCRGSERDTSRDAAGHVVTFSPLSSLQNSCTGTSCLSRQIVTNYQAIFLK